MWRSPVQRTARLAVAHVGARRCITSWSELRERQKSYCDDVAHSLAHQTIIPARLSPADLNALVLRSLDAVQEAVWNAKAKKDDPDSDAKPSKKKKDNSDGDGGDGGDGGGDDDGNGFFDGNTWNLFWAAAFCVIAIPLAWSYTQDTRAPEMETSWQSFKETLLGSDAVDRLVVVNGQYVEIYLAGSPMTLAHWFSVANTEEFEQRLQEAYLMKGISSSRWHTVKYTSRLEPNGVLQNIPTVAYVAVFLVVAEHLYKSRRGGGMGGPGGGQNPFNMTQMKSAQVQKNLKIGFKDVAGQGEAKQEIMEFVSFLQNPERFTRLGAKVPNGAILMGPPGTGKTLLAKAVAGESKVPFLSVCGSDFVEMFVGVGPGRIRSLFKQARKHERCIIYIDEIDAIARPRGNGINTGGNDERENTLNALLVEMDGFEKSQGHVIVLASTNVAPDQLDRALLRPGRFDRQIHIEKPELKERLEIFKLHLSPLSLQSREAMEACERERAEKLKADGIDDIFTVEREDPTEDELKALMPSNVETKNDLLVIHRFAERLAHLSPGFVGADIANVCNEGALITAREKREAVGLDQLEKAMDRVIGGIEKRSRVLSDFEKKVVAYHEAGHAIVGWFLKYADPLMKISIIPRGSAALGYAQYLPKETAISTATQLLDRICVLLGGRVSELIHFGHLSTGASDDLQKVTQIAYSQVSQLSMYPGGGHLSFPLPGQAGAQTQKPYSDEVAALFDDEAKNIVDSAFKRTRDLLEEKADEVKRVAEHLLKHEVITRDDFIKIVGPRPFVEGVGTHPDDDTVYAALQSPVHDPAQKE
uniref:AAA+ ATPase domain-containing protein n=1 Tax=Eutreptiella gymnastica TaxID=73025 RepID=A0A7S4LDC7_9EUGL|mmetsp:Transcript_44554/g.74970  ORF Transcript_44554/g.74970 Transcript_44554/m.74970 type:complete len:816 (+) Transcript_44554:44-2491(+)